MSLSARLNVPLLIQAGCGVSDLRKLGFTPAEIRTAGFTFQQLSVHFGVDRLTEAGFTLQDFLDNNFPLSDLAHKFPLQDLVKSKKFSLQQLFEHFPPRDLRAQGYKASDFVQLGNMSETELRRIGFKDSEIAASGITVFRTAPPTPTTLQPPSDIATKMAVGESWEHKRTGDASTFLEITYTRLDNASARALLANPHPNNLQASSHSYDGSGKNCPRCGRLFILLKQYCSSDGMCGVESGTWICDDANCGMKKEERYEGYGSIF